MRTHLVIIAVLLTAAMAWGQNNKSSDTRNGVSLDSVVVYGNTVGNRLRTSSDGSMLWDMQMMNELPKILGNADPLHYAQMLPGITTNGEYDAGLHILGCENSHNYVSIDGAPLYGVQHLLGLFSVFNAAHFQQMRLQKSNAYAYTLDRIGADLTMQTHYQPTDSLTGELAVGLISSQGTIHIPVTRKSELAVSLRGSYLNLLYSSFFQGNMSNFRYSFYDANITYNQIINDRNHLRFNMYLGNDDASMGEENRQSDIRLKWKNIMTSLLWQYDNGRLQMSDNMYYTHNTSDGSLSMQSIFAALPSSISEAGNRFSLFSCGWTTGIDISLYRIEPQLPKVSSTFVFTDMPCDVTHSLLFAPYINKEWSISSKVKANTGLRGTFYHTGSTNYKHLSPSASVAYTPDHHWNMTLGYSYRHQYITQTGMSTINTPLEFWLSSGTYGQDPQHCHSINLTTRYTTSDGDYSVSLEAYTKWLANQTEYNGTVYSFISTRYDLQSLLLHGKGHNYGINVMLSKNRGWVTGWVTYAWSRAMRTYNSESLYGTFPSSHERIHEVNGVVTFHVGKRWDIGITGVWASGQPFTAPKQMYVINQSVVTEFAEHNANRLPAYYRVDASVNYHLNPTRHIHEQGLNLSFYNLSGGKNDLFYYLHTEGETIQYRPVQLFIRVLPSISYYMKF